MKICVEYLHKYIDIPENVLELHELMEDVGLEIKRIDNLENNTVFTLELLANRGDHHCYVGVAREIHARTGANIRIPQPKYQNKTESLINADVKTDKCLNYVLAEFKKIGESESSLDEAKKRMIEMSGTNLVSSVVDVTNFVNIEIGQPLHAFDADKIKGKIQVREAGNSEKARLLFSDDVCDVPEGTIVIADDEKILAIAGVMGCEESKPTPETTHIYLESATFDPVKIRKAAHYFGIQTQSSMRFERGADPALAITGIERAVELFEDTGWSLVAPISIVQKWNFAEISFQLSLEKINEYFESEFFADQIIQVLTRYGFSVLQSDDISTNTFLISVPSHRIWDIKDSKDIYEEIARGIGYNNLPSSFPSTAAGIQPQQNQKRKELVEDVLIGEGFYEVFTDGFYSDTHRSRTGISEGHTLWEHVSIVNAGDRAYSLLKNNTLAQAIELVLTNIHVKNTDIKAFEWTRTFHPNKLAENGLCDEKKVLWFIACGENKTPNWNEKGRYVDVHYIKGIVEEFSNLLSIQLEVQQSTNNDDILPVGRYLHPTRRASIIWQNRLVGVFGEIHPDVISSWGIKSGRPCFLELSQEVFEEPPSERIYVTPSNLHPVIRDVCLLLPQGLHAIEVVNYVKESSEWISEVNVYDVFHSQATDNKNAVTFSLNYSLENAQKSNFTGEEINQETDRLVEMVLEKFKKFQLERR